MSHYKKILHTATQIALPTLTIAAQIATSLKYPQFGLILNLLAQPFWLHSSWKAWKDAKQPGLFVNTVLFSIITLFGILNYWFL